LPHLNVSKLPPSGLDSRQYGLRAAGLLIIMEIDGDQGAVTEQVIRLMERSAAKLHSQQQTAKRSLHQPDRG
jgi:hypothetical protein